MTTHAEKKQNSRKNTTGNGNHKLTDSAGEEAFNWAEEFSHLCGLAHRMFHQLEDDMDTLEPLPQSAASRKTVLAERQGIIASAARLIQLFSELLEVRQQLQKLSNGNEEALPVTEADLEVVEQYFQKCREMGVSLLGATGEK